MTLHLGLPSSAHNRNAQQNQEVKEARRILKERIRTDWDYPCLPAYQRRGVTAPSPAQAASPSSSSTGTLEGQSSPASSCDAVDEAERRVAGFRFHQPHSIPTEVGTAGNFCAEGEPVDWREREYSSASSNTEDEGGASGVNGTSPTTPSKSKEQLTSDWRFEGPDSVGKQISDRRKERKRKRDDALNQEMQWNDGLALFIARRNLWSGAKTAEQIVNRSAGREDAPVSVGERCSDTASSGSTPRTSTSTAESAAAALGSVPVQESSPVGLEPGDGTTTTAGEISPSPTTTTTTMTTAAAESTPSTTPDLDHFPSTNKTSPDDIPDSPTNLLNTQQRYLQSQQTQNQPSNLLIPIAPPILIDHPVRRRITSSIYPEIYSKIIVQSRTPSVPINLQTLMQALVQGWKNDGEWPPRSGPVEKSIGRKKGREGGEGALKHGVRAVGRVLRITSGGRGGGNGVVGAQ